MANCTFPKLMPSQPVAQPVALRTLLDTLGDRVELRPPYQRDISWTLAAMCDLVMSVMNCGLIPAIYLYVLREGDERAISSYETECIDGQHRIFSLLHFYHSRWVPFGKKKELISINYVGADKQVTHLFYKKTAETEQWVTENREKRVDYLTAEQQGHFNRFMLSVCEIRDPLTLDQRCGLFTKLQAGRPVRGSDLWKNRVDVRLVKFISHDMRWEAQTKQLLADHCSMNPKNYWLNWLLRAYLIQKAETPEALEAAYMRKDAEFNQLVKNSSPLFDTTPEQESAFAAAVGRHFAFVDALPPGTRLTPTLWFSSFAHLLKAPAQREDIISGHMTWLSTEGMDSKQRKMWEGKGFEDDHRLSVFRRSIREIDSLCIPAAAVPVGKRPPPKVRDAVWEAAFGNDVEGKCVCCNCTIYEDDWHCAHIVAVKLGGTDSQANLRPACSACNWSMGIENLWDYKRRCYPEVVSE